MEDFINNQIQVRFNYVAYVVIMMIGLWGLIAKKNLIKKLIGMSIFQTAIILLYVSLGYKGPQSGIPIHQPKKVYVATADKDKATATAEVDKAKAEKSADKKEKKKAYPTINPDKFANPLPHVLMLTAIVVGVATLGVALAIAQSIFRDFGTLEETEILEKIKTGDYAQHD